MKKEEKNNGSNNSKSTQYDRYNLRNIRKRHNMAEDVSDQILSGTWRCTGADRSDGFRG